MAPDEARFRANLPAVPGGAYPYLQQQNYSLEALAKRDANDPFAKPAASSPPALPPAEEPQAAMLDAFNEAEFLDALEKELCRG
jgi:phage portal protein BeeE